MPPRALIISNLHAPDCIGGYEMVASECMDALERNHGWQITCHCARTGRPETAPLPYPPRVRADLTGYFPRGWKHHHALLPAARALQRTPQIVAELQREAAAATVILLFNPRRLTILQWLPAMQTSRNPIAWVSDHWPSEYPDCDKLWQASQTERISFSPLAMAGAARIRKHYAKHHPAPADLACIKRAAFVSEYILKKNAPCFPNLEEATVIHNGITPALFPFAPMTPDRWRTWGFCGRIHPEKGVALALDLFAHAAQTRPDLRFLLAGDMTATTHGAEIRHKIAAHPILARQVTLLGKIPRDRLATDFYHKTGVLLFTSQWDEPFALTVVEAMSCGTYIAATATGGTPEIVTSKTGLLLPRASIETTDPMLAALPTAPTRLIEEQLAAACAAAGNKTIRQMAESLAAFAGGSCAAS
jgi:glycosyltransferase involved in cell wall biosynthesis